MPRIAVSLDLETTGLDPSRDAILEIGAVKFRGEEVLDEWKTLVNPGRSIPPKIVELTGITSEEVNQKGIPLFEALRQAEQFVRDLPIVGHNIAFDLSFLNRQRIFTRNTALDTFELAGILVPHAGRYGLAALAQELGIELPKMHRALADAQVTHALYVKLAERARNIPAKTLQEILRLSTPIDWPARAFFEDALRESARGAFSGGSIGAQLAAKQATQRRRRSKSGGPIPALIAQSPLFARPGYVAPLRPNPEVEPIEVDLIAALLELGGEFEHAIEQFEHRPQQVQMLRAICTAFNNGQHLMVEAGTGTGKSLAYLLPAIHWAVQNGERVVISTNTINLQEQLALKDAPAIQQALRTEFRAAVLKGRSHYLCPARLAALLQSGPVSSDEMRVLAKVLLWLPSTVSGDGDELFLPNPAERGVWARLCADNPTCTNDRCAQWGDTGCFFHNARREAEGAHVLIVNHSLLLADVAVANRALPEYKYLIVDEAHHLEAATTDQLSFSINQYDLRRTLDELSPTQSGRGPGLLEDAVGRVRSACPAEIASSVQAYADRVIAALEDSAPSLEAFFDQVRDFIASHTDGKSDYTQRLRLTPALRTQPAWSNIEIAWDNLSKQLYDLIHHLDRLNSALSELEQFEIPNYTEMAARLIGARRGLEELRGHTTAIVTQPAAGSIYWLEAQPPAGRASGRPLPSLHAAPLHVGPLIEQHLFKTKSSVVLTSATLCTGKSFTFIQGRLNAQEVETLAVGSPFNYKSSTLLYLVTDMPEPNAPGYQRGIEVGLIELCSAMAGRTLALFTSHAQLRATARVLVPELARRNILVFEQSDGSSRRQLLDRFRNAERGVLLGTRSFWEGVDVAGEALSCLAITRLPFAVPTDPIFAARSEAFDESFTQYAVPDAVLRFRQGFGRLIRTKTDHGVVVVFDRRIISKQYGQMFLQSLPECTVRRGPTTELARAVTAWMKAVNGLDNG
ncbi:MAG TPA: helicase C-terminal domain-containing protein [Anaerolineae bacterium]|nr:helicase C-terminal domain-containing protein [Anaerolineae bacterium]